MHSNIRKDLIDTDLAWAAGFIDGEGAIQLIPKGTNGSYFTLYLTCSQNSTRPLLKLQEMFGGIVKFSQITAAGNRHHVWRTAAITATQALTLMLPYLLEKKEEAEIALLMQSKKGPKGKGNRYTDEQHLELQQIYLMFRNSHDRRVKGISNGR